MTPRTTQRAGERDDWEREDFDPVVFALTKPPEFIGDALGALARLKIRIEQQQARIEEARKLIETKGLLMMNTPATWHRFMEELYEALDPSTNGEGE